MPHAAIKALKEFHMHPILQKTSLALAAAGALALLAPAAHAAGEAKNVIFFLGDGMGPVTTTATRVKYVGEEGSLAMDKLRCLLYTSPSPRDS